MHTRMRTSEIDIPFKWMHIFVHQTDMRVWSTICCNLIAAKHWNEADNSFVEMSKWKMVAAVAVKNSHNSGKHTPTKICQ